jgi:hypothetical protein
MEIAVTLQFLNCVPVGSLDGHDLEVVFAYPSIDCNSDRYNRWLPAIWTILVTGILSVPPFFEWYLMTACPAYDIQQL